MMRLGKLSLETTSSALVPRALLTATLLTCCRLRGVSKEREHYILFVLLDDLHTDSDRMHILYKQTYSHRTQGRDKRGILDWCSG